MDDNHGMEMVDIIRETFGTQLDETNILVLLHILAAGQIYVVSDICEDGYCILEHTQRHAGEVIAQVMGIQGHMNYMQPLNLYDKRFGANFYEMPREYHEARDAVLKKLLAHDKIVDIELGY
ncbi:MAG: hypothetical protein H7175_19935 [Burkholderiales bacterium]|nr:hypothetical protein [Anaerolineae bacterium]